MTGLFYPMLMTPIRIELALINALLTAVPSAGATSDASAQAMRSRHAVVELRQYTLHPDQRDALIELFDRSFVESQEAQGMRIIGQFRDLDNRDRFVWLRSFVDMPSRAVALQAFYSGPIWRSHREAANATMVDSENVLLLKPVRPETAFPVDHKRLPPLTATGAGDGLIVGNIVYLRRSAPGKFEDFFDQHLKPQLLKAGASIVAELVSDHSVNNFPNLPVREGENVFVWFSAFPDAAVFEQHRRALANSTEWRQLTVQLSLWTHQRIETLRLQPTARSRLHG